MATPIPPSPDGAGDSVAMIAKWIRRCGFPFAILGWTGVALLPRLLPQQTAQPWLDMLPPLQSACGNRQD